MAIGKTILNLLGGARRQLWHYDEENDAYVMVTTSLSEIESGENAFTTVFGENADVDTAAEILGADTQCFEVMVQARKSNTGIISVGLSGGQFIELSAGESFSFPISNVNLIYVKASVNNQAVNYAAKVSNA